MKKQISTILLASFCCVPTFSAERGASIKVYSDNIEQAVNQIRQIASNYQAQIVKSEQSPNYSAEYSFVLDDSVFDRFRKTMESKWEVADRHEWTLNHTNAINKLQLRKEHLKQRKTLLKKMYEQPELPVDTNQVLGAYDVAIVIKNKQGEIVSDYQYTTNLNRSQGLDQAQIQKQQKEYYRQLGSINDLLLDIQTQRLELEDKLGKSLYTIEVRKRMAAGEDREFSLVNMPGVSYDYFFVENYEKDQNAEQYQGLRLKYMFSKGKSYFTVGAMRAVDDVDTTSAVSEMFLFSLGTDFYPRYLGRGKRTFLNLYTGVELGGAIFVSEDKSDFFFMGQPKLGLEIFKTSRLLLDVSGAYFLPFVIENNRYYRGFLTSASLNFIF